MTQPLSHESDMEALQRAVPYLRMFRDKTFVIKVGGEVGEVEEQRRTLAEQVRVLWEVGIRVVLVHGGGPQTTALCERLGVPVRMVGGRRITDERALETAILALNGAVNTAWVASLRGLGVRRVPVNFLNPRPGTPLAGRSVLAPREALRILAVLRFLLPDAEIRTCGGRSLALGPLESWMFHAGASATMIGNYLTTKGRPPAEDVAMLDALGLEPKARLRGRGPRATHDASPSGVPEERPGEPLRRDR